MNVHKRLNALKNLKLEIGSPSFRTLSVEERRDSVNKLVSLLNFSTHCTANAMPVADILSRPGFTSSMYDQAHARLMSVVIQAINDLEQELPSPELPTVNKVRQTQLAAWPVVFSVLLEICDSDGVQSAVSIAGLDIDWSLSTAESYSHLTRIRAYRPRIDAAYKKLDAGDQSVALSIIAAELARRYPEQVGTIRNALVRVGWTMKVTAEKSGNTNQEIRAMKRNKELQKLLLTELRDGHAPVGLSSYSEADQLYNSALLINDSFVDGQIIRDANGDYATTVMTQLTSAGHDFLEADEVQGNVTVEQSFPVELTDSLKRFRLDHPDPSQCAFVMMRFGATSAHTAIVQSLRDELAKHKLKALRADDKDYHDDLFSNILTYVYGCAFGIAIFERIEQDEFNPNVALEVGYMMALKKPMLLLKDRTLQNLNTDLVGKLYKTFDVQDISKTIAPQVQRWLKDRNIIGS